MCCARRKENRLILKKKFLFLTALYLIECLQEQSMTSDNRYCSLNTISELPSNIGTMVTSHAGNIITIHLIKFNKMYQISLGVIAKTTTNTYVFNMKVKKTIQKGSLCLLEIREQYVHNILLWIWI